MLLRDQVARALTAAPQTTEQIASAIAARSREWTEPVIVNRWTLPKGAFGEKDGPC